MNSNQQKTYPVTGSGLGLRRDLLDELEANFPAGIDFMGVAPENWIGVASKLGKRLRDGCLNQHWFKSLADARQIIQDWRQHYNHERPHSSLGYQAPAVFEAKAA